jgi:hypothetical protein
MMRLLLLSNALPAPRGQSTFAGESGGQGQDRTADLPLFSRDITRVGADRASVMRCRRSLP